MKKLVFVIMAIFMFGCDDTAQNDDGEMKLNFALSIDGVVKNAAGEYDLVTDKYYPVVLDLSPRNFYYPGLQISAIDYILNHEGDCSINQYNFDARVRVSSGKCIITATISDFMAGTETAKIKVNAASPAETVTGFYLISAQEYGNDIYLPPDAGIYLGGSKSYTRTKDSGNCVDADYKYNGANRFNGASGNDVCKITFTESGGSDNVVATIHTINSSGNINKSNSNVMAYAPIQLTAQPNLTGTIKYDWYFTGCGHAIKNKVMYKTKLINGGKTITYKPGLPSASCQVYVVAENNNGDIDVVSATFKINNYTH